MIPTVGFIGAGATASALAAALQSAGYRINGVASRGSSATRLATSLNVPRLTPDKVASAADLVLIAVPDDAIESVARSVPWPPGVLVAHVSGSRSLDLLAAAADRGAAVGSFHPLQSFAGSTSLDGVTFGIEGDDAVYEELSAVAKALGGRPLRLEQRQKAIYHLAGTLTSNFQVALAWAAGGLWEQAGLTASRQEALEMFLPLIRGTVANLEGRGVPRAMTGPATRGDGGTVLRHLEALKTLGASDVLSAYRALMEIAVAVARARGLDRAAAERVTDVLRGMVSR